MLWDCAVIFKSFGTVWCKQTLRDVRQEISYDATADVDQLATCMGAFLNQVAASDPTSETCADNQHVPILP